MTDPTIIQKIGRALSRDSTEARGRNEEPFIYSSGRGGAGNIRRTSTSRDARPSGPGPEDFSQTRGRELGHTNVTTPSKFVTAGRGGAGNYRSPSRDQSKLQRELEQEQDVIEAVALRAEESGALRTSGRGGYGNVDRSRSRSRGASGRPSGESYLSSVLQSGQEHPAAADLDRLDEEGKVTSN